MRRFQYYLYPTDEEMRPIEVKLLAPSHWVEVGKPSLSFED